MATHKISADVLLRLAAQKGLTTNVEIAKAAGVSPRTVQYAVTGTKELRADTCKKFANAVGLGDDFSQLVDWSPDDNGKLASDKDLDSVGFPCTVADNAVIAGNRPTDLKLVLKTMSLRESLLAGQSSPTFAECVSDAIYFTPMDDAHKDHPFVPETTYNHFFQPGAIISLRDGDARVLGYQRSAQPGSPDYQHTQGWSVLFAADYIRNVHRHPRMPMDEWTDLVQSEPTKAADTFMRYTLAMILEYKIDFRELVEEVKPLGVISNDQRRNGSSRVYTQFVFHVFIDVDTRRMDRILSRIAPTLVLKRLPDNLHAESAFVGKGGRANAMDILAWRAIRCDDEFLRFESATFCRNFQLV